MGLRDGGERESLEVTRGLAEDPPMPFELAVTTATSIAELDAGIPRVFSRQANPVEAATGASTAAPQLLPGTITEPFGGLVVRHTELEEKRQGLLQLQQLEEEQRQRLQKLQKLEEQQEAIRQRLSSFELEGSSVHRHEMS